MTYNDTIQWLFSQLPMYQRQGASAYKKDLSNTIDLASHLNNPEIKFKSIHVGGTNGKGSTSHMLASILQESGYTVGLYTSPHLKDFRERIKINGKEISKQFVMGFIRRNKPYFETNSLSFFEMTVGMAFEYFAKKKVDIAIVEVGLGGRLDSTNIITPVVSVITNIGLDHTRFLGDTIEEIAFEKAGIIKKSVPVVIGESEKVTRPIFERIAKERQTILFFADEGVKQLYKSDLIGNYQRNNMKTVLQTVTELKKQGYKISISNIENGLLRVVSNTGLKGRWQVLQYSPKVICDIAHNKEGLSYTMTQLINESYDNLHIVIGFVSDKNLESVIPLFPKKASYYFCKPNIKRGMNVEQLMSSFKAKGYDGEAYESVEEAFKEAKIITGMNDVIYVGGSTFVVAEII